MTNRNCALTYSIVASLIDRRRDVVISVVVVAVVVVVVVIVVRSRWSLRLREINIKIPSESTSKTCEMQGVKKRS